MATKKGKSAMGPSLSFSVFYEEAPEGGYVVSAPALPGCHTQGEPIREEGRSWQGKVSVPVIVRG
jgi:hypothetical protein